MILFLNACTKHNTTIPPTASFSIPGKLIVDFPALTGFINHAWGYNGIGYGLELYAQDNNGNITVNCDYE